MRSAKEDLPPSSTRVKIYEALPGPDRLCRPVVVNPAISFTQLACELRAGDERRRARLWCADQFIAKLQRPENAT